MKRILWVILTLALPLAAQHSIALTWSPWTQGTGDPATGLNVKYSYVSGGQYTAIASLPITAVSYTVIAVCPPGTNGTTIPCANPQPLPVGTTIYLAVVPTTVLPTGAVAEGPLSPEAVCTGQGAPKCVIPFAPSPVTGLTGIPK